jgi:hypothetical protein
MEGGGNIESPVAITLARYRSAATTVVGRQNHFGDDIAKPLIRLDRQSQFLRCPTCPVT